MFFLNHPFCQRFRGTNVTHLGLLDYSEKKLRKRTPLMDTALKVYQRIYHTIVTLIINKYGNNLLQWSQ